MRTPYSIRKWELFTLIMVVAIYKKNIIKKYSNVVLKYQFHKSQRMSTGCKQLFEANLIFINFKALRFLNNSRFRSSHYCHVRHRTQLTKMASRKFIGNFVAIDAIHQDRVRKEQLAQKNWEKNHGYMIEEIKKVITYQ